MHVRSPVVGRTGHGYGWRVEVASQGAREGNVWICRSIGFDVGQLAQRIETSCIPSVYIRQGNVSSTACGFSTSTLSCLIVVLRARHQDEQVSRFRQGSVVKHPYGDENAHIKTINHKHSVIEKNVPASVFIVIVSSASSCRRKQTERHPCPSICQCSIGSNRTQYMCCLREQAKIPYIYLYMPFSPPFPCLELFRTVIECCS